MEDIICKRCGLVNDYYTVQVKMHIKAMCNECNKYIKFIPQEQEVKLWFGKYKYRTIKSMVSEEELNYLEWIKNGGIKNIKENY
jgi:hypothetical protein